MKILSAVTLLMLSLGLTSSGLAVTFKVNSKTAETKRKAANESVEAEVALISQISNCVSKVKSPEELNVCAKEYIASSRTEDQKKALLIWFTLPMEMPTPEKCKPEALEFVPEKIMKGSKAALCSSYNLHGLDKKAIFLISEEGGKLKLLNLRE